MVNADWRLLVAFLHLVGTEFAVRDVVVGDETRAALVVLVKVEASLLRVDDNDGVLWSGCICSR